MKKKYSLLITGCVLIALAGQAQIDLQNTGILYSSSSSDTLYINGNFINTSTAALTNAGSLYVRQNLTNNQASMAAGTGILYLNGSGAQIVNGTQMFKTFNLNTNNGAGITLNNDLSVDGAHTYAAGMIITSATPNYLVYQAGSSYSGDGDSKHVNGWVKKYGTTAFTFPVGNATIERTIGIAGLSASSEFNARYNATTPYSTQLQSPLVSLDKLEYWSLNKITGGSASVAMNWDNSKVAFPNWVLSDIAVAGYNGSLWTDRGGSAAGNTATTGTITSSSISSFDLFTFGSRSYVVPLSLISFSANKVEDYVHLEWKTANEYNVDHFTVERSDDGVNFYSIQELPARNSGETESYSYNDTSPVGSIVYYRLRSTDIDGKTRLSPVVTVMFRDAGGDLIQVINPVHDYIILQAGQQSKGSFDYRVTTASGQLVQQGNLVISGAGQYQLRLSSNLRSGACILTMTNGQKAYSFKLIVR